MARKVGNTMPVPTPVITKMTYHANSDTGCEVHVWTEKHGEMDITLTVDQYHRIHTQLADTGRATVPTYGTAAA
jgi:hypothetical protein